MIKVYLYVCFLRSQNCKLCKIAKCVKFDIYEQLGARHLVHNWISCYEVCHLPRCHLIDECVCVCALLFLCLIHSNVSA